MSGYNQLQHAWMHYNLQDHCLRQVNTPSFCILSVVTYGEEKKPATDARWTIAPPPLFAICRRATFVPLITAVVLILIILSSNASSKGVNIEFAPAPIPALSNA